MKNTKLNLIVAYLISTVWGVLLMQVQVVAAAGAREYENPPCYDITGKSTAVLRSGVPNSGLMDFDDAGVGKMYQACVRMDGVSVAAKPDHLEGWVWNDNLGWVSLYCDASGKNLGISCGTIPYKVSFTVSGGTSPDFSSAKLSGYAWNDNAGYISFFSGAFHQVMPTAADPNRGLIKSVDLKDTSVWSDAVGWFNLTGVKLNWNATPMKKVTPVATVKGYTSICSSQDDPAPSPPSEPAVTYPIRFDDNSVPAIPKSVAYDSKSNAVWVAFSDGSSAAKVRKYHADTGSFWLAYNPFPLSLNEVGSYLVKYDSAKDQVYVGSSTLSSGAVFALRGDNAVKIWNVDMGGPLKDIFYDSKNGVVWALGQDVSGMTFLLKINSSTGVVIHSTSFNIGTITDSKLLFDSDQDIVWAMINKTSGTLTDFVRFSSTGDFIGGTYDDSKINIGNPGDFFRAMTYDSVNKAVWALNSSRLIKLDSETGDYYNGNYSNSTYDPGLAVFGGVPDALVFDSKNKAIWVGMNYILGDTMSKLNIYSGVVEKKYPHLSLHLPTAFALQDSDNSIWFTNGNNFITKMVGRGLELQETNIVLPACKNDLDSVVLPANKMPFADGVDKYSFKIPFVDGALIDNSQIEQCSADSMSMYATPVTAGKGYCAMYSVDWDDSVDVDQTTLESQTNGSLNPYKSTNSNPKGAVNKPVNYKLFGGDFAYEVANKMWGAEATSVAPTSDQNVSEGMNNEKFYFGSDLGENYDKENSNNGQNNKLKLLKLNLLFFKYGIGGEPGTCLYGDIVDPVGADPAYKCQMKTYVKDVNLGFRPFVALDTLNYVLGSNSLNYINVENVENALKFVYNTFINSGSPAPNSAPVITLKMGLENSNGYEVETPSIDTDMSAQAEFKLKKKDGEEATSLDSGAHPYLYSLVKYTIGTKTVQYFSDKLPRIKAGLLKNPVALIQGNVYLTDYEVKSTGIESDNKLKSLGNIASNLKREQILRNVNKYLRGKSVMAGSAVTISDFNSVPASMTKLLEDSTKVVYYLKGADLILTAGTYDKNTTLIVDGGSIKVNSDLGPAATNKNAQLGLIALKDLANSSDNGGFVYVDKEVGLMQNVNVYADRLLVSYDKVQGFDASSGYPIYLGADDLTRQQTLGNQFVLVGTISSMNGVGSASRAIPLDENGGPVNKTDSCDYNTSTQAGLCKARIADLNYLRYYGPTLEACPLTSVPRDQALKVAADPTSGCDPTAVGYDIDASALYSVDVNGDLISGQEAGNGKKSAYFAGKTGLKTEYPVNFFYKAISNDLGGFEKESTFNPLLQN